jgi:hypothetical protein
MPHMLKPSPRERGEGKNPSVYLDWKPISTGKAGRTYCS